MRQKRNVGDAHDLDEDERTDEAAGYETWVCAEARKHERCKRGVDRVVGKKPKRNSGRLECQTSDLELTCSSATGNDDEPGAGEKDGGGKHPSKSSGDPVGGVATLTIVRVERHCRREPADDEEERHDLQRPADPAEARNELDGIATNNPAGVCIGDRNECEPVAESYKEHGDDAVEVDRTVAIGLCGGGHGGQ